MMKKINYTIVVSLSMMIMGCTSTPSVETMQTVTLANGKQYAVPTKTTYTQRAVTPKVIKFYQKLGLSSCKDGDITWEDKATADKINNILRTGSKDEGISVYENAAKAGKIGCASPLN
jgi:uncharacterized protein YlzI (FlbEa/FlbD family)